MNQSLIHYLYVYLAIGKFPFLVPVIRYPTWCNFIMHCLQNILDIIHTEWALEVSLFWQRSNFPSLNIRYYAHLGNHPVTAVLPPSYGRGVDSTKVILPVFTTLITSWSKDIIYHAETILVIFSRYPYQPYTQQTRTNLSVLPYRFENV